MAVGLMLRHVHAMPRYFFHVQNQTSYAHDENGVELIDLPAARRHAAAAAGEILTSDLADGRNLVVFEIRIADHAAQTIVRLRVSGDFSDGPGLMS